MIAYKKAICVMMLLAYAITFGNNTVRANASVKYGNIDNQLKKDLEELHIPGMAVAIVDAKEVLLAKTYGNCKSIDTPFILGSVSKSFTALAIMRLVEEDKIDLDEKISTYIDPTSYFINASDGDRITVRQLLNQTGGLGTYQRFGNAKITESYGQHQYANVNYGLLGEMIEAVSGISYSEYMNKNIFLPLHMEHTTATFEQSKENGLIRGYRNYFGFPIAGKPDYPDEHSWSTVPAGYLSSSVSDMAKYLQMYLNGGMGIISQDSLNIMFYENVYVDDNTPYYYGMGWTLTEEYTEPVLGHSGLVENYISNMFLLPESGLGIVILINMNDYLVTNQLADIISKNVIFALLGKEQYEVSGNPYIVRHLLLNGAYFALLITAVYPIATIKRWKKKKRTNPLIAFDFIRHGILPLLLLCLPEMVGVPIWVVWYFVKDVCIVLLVSSSLLFLVGLYKIFYRMHWRMKVENDMESNIESNILEFECVGLNDGGKFPIENTGRGQDISPEFIIQNLSTNAVTLMITLEDLSHPIKGFTHWIIWNIPATDKIMKAIPPGKSVSSLQGAIQGIGYGFHCYAGPKPPKGKSHKYCFTVYVLDCKLDLPSFSFKRKVLSKASRHIIQKGKIYGFATSEET